MKLFDRLDHFGTRELKCSIIGTTAALIGAGIASAAGGVASSAIGSHAAGKAADAQSAAAVEAARIQAAQDDKALALQREQFIQQQQNMAPWLNIGRSGLANLGYLTGLFPQTGTASGTATLPQVNAPSAATSTAPQQKAEWNPQNQYGGQSFNSLINSGDPNISPNQETTNAWQAAGIPFTNITSSDGRSVAIRNPEDNNGQSLPDVTGSGNYTNLQSLSSLVNPGLGAPGSLLAPWTEQFKAPDNVTEQNDPGYQFRLNEGTKALERSAAARGDILSGATAKGIQRYGQDYASNEYQNVYGRSLQDYLTRYNVFQNNQTNTFNRLAALSGVGQTAANTINQGAQNFGNAGSTILMNSGNAQASGINNAGAARASGYLNSGSIWGGGVNALTNNLTQLAQMYQLQNAGNVAPMVNPGLVSTLPLSPANPILYPTVGG